VDCELLVLPRMVTSSVEHSSVLNHCMALEKEGYRVAYLPVTATPRRVFGVPLYN
jgi:cysteine sulfinate desulfinase/cysteine desulfurase-like protein